MMKARLLAAKAAGRVAYLGHLVNAPARSALAWTGRRSYRLLIALQDIRTADPIAAEDIYAGHFSLSGKTASTHGYSPFTIPPPSTAWSEALHGFGWLRHLRAADTVLSRANARALVEDWLTLDARGALDRAVARDPKVTARRLISWLAQSPMILEGAEHAFYRRFTRAIEAHTRALERALAGRLEGEARLTALVAITQAGLCLENANALLRRATLRLSKELPKQILRDGGHIGRNPRVLVDLLIDFLPTRQAFVARGVPAPDAFLNAVDRMIPMLRLFRHGDGELAGFNGMGVSEPGAMATLLAHDPAGAPMLEAPYSGYERLEASETLVVADVGAPPPPLFSRCAHAGCLAFELSVGLHRFVINCGEPAADLIDAREAARATAAHSTLILDDHSSCRFEPIGLKSIAAGLVLEGPSVETRRSVDEAGGLILEAQHDGYARRFGALHRRTLYLTADGAALYGEDRLLAARDKPITAKTWTLRFHLHPSARVDPAVPPGQALVVLPSGETWRFWIEGRAVEIEESVFFSAPGGPRATAQLVARGNVVAEEPIAWGFARAAVGA